MPGPDDLALIPVDDATARQRRAADPAVSVWVGASAGTGKTKVLVDRVLRLMLGGTPPQRILCLTFTKAAAAEMENRVAATLAGWATLADADLAGRIASLTGTPPDEDALRIARRLFARVLDAPGGLRIDTIHAFCQSVLRRFPVEAQLPPGFGLIEEQDAADLQRAARRTVLASADPAIAEAVAEIATHGEDDFGSIMAAIAAGRGRLERLMRDHGGVEPLCRAVGDHLGLDMDSDGTVAEAEAAFCRDDATDADRLRRAMRALQCGGKTDQAKATCIADFLAAEIAARPAGLPAYRRAFLTGEGQPYSKVLTKAAAAADPDAEAILLAEAERLLALDDLCRRIRTARATRALLVLGDAFIRRYAAEKARLGVLDYDDLIARTAMLLADHGQAWVLYKLDGGIDHVLVDEAQDTNPEQWDLILRLIEEFTAGESARDIPRTVFVVGDEKQSIFSFQGADREAFGASLAELNRRHRQSGHPFETVPLETSFRSTDAVLALVDQVFAGEAARAGVATSPPLHLVSAHREGDAGAVELWPALAIEEGDPDPAWEPPTEQRGPSSAAARLAERIARQIRAWLTDRENLPARGRPIRPDDILILVRTRNRFFLEIVRWLKKLDVPVAGADRMVLTDQLAVMDLLALGRFLLLPEDDLSLAELLKGPFIGFDDDRLFALAHARKGTLWSALAAAARHDPEIEAARRWLAALLARADRVPPFELFAGALGAPCPADAVSGRRAIARRLGAEAEEPLDSFLDQCLVFGRRFPPSLQRFIGWMGAGEIQVKRQQEAGGGAVRIMTVHGSKGLQAPIVILPDTVAKPQPSARGGERILWPGGDLPVPLWAPRATDVCAAYDLAQKARAERMLGEYRRLLYVALTRAEDRLIVCGHLGAQRMADDCWHALCAGGFRRLPGLVEVAGEDGGPPTLRYETPQRRAVAPAVAPLPEAAATLPDWARRPPPPEPSPFRPLTPSRPDEPDPPALSPLLAVDRHRFRRGAIIHTLLQHLPAVAPAERAAAAGRWIARQDLPAEATAEILATTLAVLDAPGLAAIFGPGSRAEVPVTALLGDRVLSGQIDRLLVADDGVIAVDFKTNRPPPQRAEDVAGPYLRQMAMYRAALRAMFPGRPVRCALLWTEGPRVMDLADDLLDRHAPVDVATWQAAGR